MANDLDDELLALAGGNAPSDDDGFNVEVEAASKRPRAKPSTSSRTSTVKKRRVQKSSDDDEDDDEDDEDADAGPMYPLEGLYKDEDDKARIDDLPLIERETILAQRKDEVMRRDRTAQLASMVARQQGAAVRSKKLSAKKSTQRSTKKVSRGRNRAESDMEESEEEDDDEDDEDDDDDDDGEDADDYAGPAVARKGRVRKSVGTSDTRNKKLQELSENRKKKAEARSSRPDDDGEGPSGGRKARRSSSDSDEGSDESEGYYESEDDDRRGGRASASAKAASGRSRRRDEGVFVPPDLTDANQARIGRNDIMRIMYRKGWEDKLVGNFVRVVADPKRDERTGKMTPRYRAYEIVDWKRGSKWYQVDEGKFTNVLLVLQFAKEKHEKQILFVSNSDITEEEFQRYLLQAEASPNRASKGQLQDQADIWSDFVGEAWTEDDFTEVVRARKEAKRQAEAQKANGGAGARSAAPGNGASAKSEPRGEDVLLAELNERNRKLDRERIQEATRKQAEIRRAAALAAAQREKAQQQGTTAVAANGSGNKPGDADGGEIGTSQANVEIDLGDF